MNAASSTDFYPALADTLQALLQEEGQIDEERRRRLDRLAAYIADHRRNGHPVNLTFICTHNSRRSHIGQIWAATAAAWFGLDSVRNFSGGTEATAFNPRAVAALERVGFRIENPGGENPHYLVRFSDEHPPQEVFSKVYGDSLNPVRDFAAIMTCSEADANCPFIPGADLRLPLTYEDPKEADGTPEEQARYDERVRQIGREILYAMQQARQLLQNPN